MNIFHQQFSIYSINMFPIIKWISHEDPIWFQQIVQWCPMFSHDFMIIKFKAPFKAGIFQPATFAYRCVYTQYIPIKNKFRDVPRWYSHYATISLENPQPKSPCPKWRFLDGPLQPPVPGGKGWGKVPDATPWNRMDFWTGNMARWPHGPRFHREHIYGKIRSEKTCFNILVHLSLRGIMGYPNIGQSPKMRHRAVDDLGYYCDILWLSRSQVQDSTSMSVCVSTETPQNLNDFSHKLEYWRSFAHDFVPLVEI